MKTYFVKLSVALLIGLFAATSAQAWYFEIDNLDNDLTIDIWFNPDGEALRLDNYQLDFGFDLQEIAWVDYTNTPPTGLIADLFGPAYEQSAGVIWNFSAATFANGPVVDTRIQLGTLTFALLNPDTSIQDGLDDIWFIETGNNLVTLSDVAYSTVGLSGVGLDIGNPVPVPAAVWLLGSGLLGLAGLRRRNR